MKHSLKLRQKVLQKLILRPMSMATMQQRRSLSSLRSPSIRVWSWMMSTLKASAAISPVDLAMADTMGYAVKLVAHAHRTDHGIDVRVHPTMIPLDHQLAKVNGVFNAIYVIGDAVGETMFFGEGAGAGPAASAVMGDVLEVARHLHLGVKPIVGCTCTDNIPVISVEELQTKYYLRFLVEDRTGVGSMRQTSTAKYDVSLQSVQQRGTKARDAVNLVSVTHTAHEDSVAKVIDEILALPNAVIGGYPSVIRVQD